MWKSTGGNGFLLLNPKIHFLSRFKRESLKVLGTVGEPINPEAWHWYYNVVGEKRCPIVDTFWQTETVSSLVSCVSPCWRDSSPAACTVGGGND